MPFSKLYSISYDAFKFESPDGTDTTSIIAGLVRVTFTSLVGAIIKISYSEEQDEFKKDVVVIGAGAAGMMCALEAGKRGRKVLLLDHATNLAEKFASLAEVVVTLPTVMPVQMVFCLTIPTSAALHWHDSVLRTLSS